MEHKFPSLHKLANLAKKYDFSDAQNFTKLVRIAFAAYYQALSEEPPSEDVKRLSRRAEGGNPRKESHNEYLFIKMAEMNNSENVYQAAADMMSGGTRRLSAEGLFVERLLATWRETHGNPLSYTSERNRFLAFLFDVDATIRPESMLRHTPVRTINDIINKSSE